MIRPEKPTDAAAIHAVHAAGFATDAEARLVDALRATGRLTVSLVAETDSKIVGHVAFSPVTVMGDDDETPDESPSDVTGLGLAPVAVLASHRRRGIAAALIREGIANCRAAGVGFIVVLGDPAYYHCFGFEPASRFGLRDEYGGGDAFQVMALSADSMPTGGGLVKYVEQFGQLG